MFLELLLSPSQAHEFELQVFVVALCDEVLFQSSLSEDGMFLTGIKHVNVVARKIYLTLLI